MQLFLASILSGAALLVGVFAQPDWKPYSSSEGQFVVSLPDEPRTSTIVTATGAGPLFTHIVSANDGDLNEYLVSWTDYHRNVEEKATEKTFDRMRDALIRQREGKLTNESATMIAGRTGRAFAFTDKAGHTVNVKFYFVGQRSFEMLAESRSKANLADVDKFFASFKVSELVKRDVQKVLDDSEREARAEIRAAKREAKREVKRDKWELISDDRENPVRDDNTAHDTNDELEHSQDTDCTERNGFSRP
jgi:hypothetical protein